MNIRSLSFLSWFFLILLIARPSIAALLVDDCEGISPANRLGGYWSSYSDVYSAVTPKPFAYSPEGYGSAHCARIDMELKAGLQYPYAGMNTSFAPQDLSAYEGVRFYAKGSGDWNCQIPLTSTSKEYNHFSCPIALSSDWKLFELPFNQFTQTWGTHKPWDPTQVTGVQWAAAGTTGAKGFLCVDNIEFYKKNEATLKAPEANPILNEPKVNQQGYLPDGGKTFVVSEIPGGVKKGDSFKVEDEAGHTAFSGKIQSEPIDDLKSTGEKVFQVDFSGLTLPGRYTVVIDGVKSQPFSIGDGVYLPLFKDALRCFYLIRCGTAIDDTVTGIKHEACHIKDAPAKDGTKTGDLTGGWHNAGDYGKWTLEESISCAYMMWVYELKTPLLKDLNNHIPESGNGVSDLLNEAKWGLTWLLKMQRSDGSVWHKVDSEDHFCFGTVPEKDPTQRYAQFAGTIDAADFVGAMCQASRVFAHADPAFSQKCAKAAKQTWAWLEKNPNLLQNDPDYVDTDPSQERLWALGEFARLTEDPSLQERFSKEATPDKLKPTSWQEPQLFGYMAQAFDPKNSSDGKDTIQKALVNICDPLVQASQINGYGVVQASNEYWWETNENLLGKTAALLFAHALTGDSHYRATALRQMDWILGENSLGFSFVTGHGTRSTSHPYHWDCASLGKVMPGWVSGGPNEYPTGADYFLTTLINRGTPPAKCFVDACGGNGSWASNEGETSQNAVMVFCAGYLSGN